jgi:hypothetical protein
MMERIIPETHKEVVFKEISLLPPNDIIMQISL